MYTVCMKSAQRTRDHWIRRPVDPDGLVHVTIRVPGHLVLALDQLAIKGRRSKNATRELALELGAGLLASQINSAEKSEE